MNFLISLLTAAVFAAVSRQALRKKPVPFYLLAILAAIGVYFLKSNSFEAQGITRYLCDMFEKAGFSTALFVLVMYAGALPAGSRCSRLLMPIRGQLSILASILTLGHNAAYGRTYFVWLLTDRSRMSNLTGAAAVCSLIMITVMLPLFATSFLTIRRKMKPVRWKRLQRWAYLFYGLIYVHVMLLNFSQRQLLRCQVNMAVYTTVFSHYAVCRILKALHKKDKTYPLGRTQCFAALLCAAAGSLFLMVPKNTPASSPLPHFSETTEAASRSLQDGTFSGTAYGYAGNITVSITVEAGQIIDIRFTGYDDELEYFDYGQDMLSIIRRDPETGIDSISGATYTTSAVRRAYNAALDSAAVSP